MADSSAVDAALVAKLLGDATLMAMVPDKVYFDVAPPNATKFVIVSQEGHEDTYAMPEADAFERFSYLVKAVIQGTGSAEVSSAAARIHTLLHHGTLSPTGYAVMTIERTQRIRYLEVDDAANVRWQHRGGIYDVWVSPT